MEQTASDEVRRRRRPAVSCAACRRRKIRCNRQAPCNNCLRSRRNEPCVYDHHPPLGPSDRSQPTTTQEAGGSSMSDSRTSPVSGSNPSTSLPAPNNTPTEVREANPAPLDPRSHRSEAQVEWAPRISQLTRRAPTSSQSDIQEKRTRIGGSFYFDRDLRGTGRTKGVIRSVGHKRRMFSQGHWLTLVPWIDELVEYIEAHIRDEASSAFTGLMRCKSLARFIKNSRLPPWPCPPTRDLPPKDVADRLVESYLRSIETLYRILHIPSFRRDYEAMWTSSTEVDMAFLIQVKLVMAVGAATHDDSFTFRDSAMRWVYEAQTWMSNPLFKSRVRVDLIGIQSHILLLIARELTGVDDDAVWISAGALLREGMFAVLHRDPSRLPKNAKFAAEMRRRLWTSILEVSLQTSLTSGSPPHLSLEDFDVEPPENYDDEQLLDEDSVPKPDTEFTQSSVARALRKTFPQRLAVAKQLNDVGSRGTYDDTLRIDSEFRKSWKSMSRTLQACRASSSAPAGDFSMRTADYIMSHYLSVLHSPFFGVGLHEAAYAYSRKVAVEMALKAWSTAHPSLANPATTTSTDNASADDDNLHRLCVGGSSGYFRTVSFQSGFVIAMELSAKLREETSLGLTTVRPDLLAVVENSKTITLRAVHAGRTNMKGHLLMCLFSAYIDGLRRGVSREEMSNLIGQATVEAEERALPVLERIAAQYQTGEGATGQSEDLPLDPVDLMGDWYFLVSDPLFSPEGSEPMFWETF